MLSGRLLWSPANVIVGTMTSRNTTLDDFSLSDDWLNYTCQRCGIKFHASKSAKRKYCSDKCARAARIGVKHTPEHIKKMIGSLKKKTKSMYHCFTCGKLIKRRPSMINRSDRHFCSRRCYGIYTSKTRSGENSPQYGKPSSFKGHTHTDEAKKKLSDTRKELFKDQEFKDQNVKIAMNNMQASPNKAEKRIIDIVSTYDLPFEFTGDGKFILHGLCPDFVSTDGTKKIIEVFGEHFHDPETAFVKVRWTQQEFGRKAIFSQLGYDCLIIWYKEIQSSTNKELYFKIKEFTG